MNKVENEVYDDEEEATHEEMRGVVWTVVSIVVVFGVLVSLTVIIVL